MRKLDVREQDQLKSQRRAVRSYVRGNPKEDHTAVADMTRYKVGFNWNRGGRLKELPIRHLARKYLKMWLKNTFGRVLPYRARSHHDRTVQLKAFQAWKKEWWTTIREWSLVVRAEVHHRYTLYNLTFHCWQTFTSIRRQKVGKAQQAESYAEKQLICRVWEKWEVFVQMKRMKARMLDFAFQQNRLSTVRYIWKVWQAKLQQHLDVYALEDQALELRDLTLLGNAWLQWKHSHRATCTQRQFEYKASQHHSQGLKIKVWHQWTSYVRSRQVKKHPNAVAGHARSQTLLEVYWRKWQSTLISRKDEEERLQAAEYLAKRCIQRTAMERWRTYMTLCRKDAERDQMASQCRRQHLLWVGLRCFTLNINKSKTHRQNNNVAVHHLQQTIKRKYWRFWQDCIEEKEEKFLYPQLKTAQMYYRRRQYSWVFKSWWHCSLKSKEQRLAGKMALLHHKHWCLQRAWGHWERRTWTQIDEGEKGRAADQLYERTLLQNTTGQWKAKAAEKRDRRNMVKQACRHGELHHMRWVLTRWQKSQQEESSRLDQMRHHNEEKLVKQSIHAWKKYHQQTGLISDLVEVRFKLHMQHLLRRTLTKWKENTTFLSEARVKEKRALSHFQKWQQFKVFLAWRHAAEHAIAKCLQQEEVLTRAQSHINHVWQQDRFRQWRLKTKETIKDRTEIEKAVQHHHSKLLSSALKSWSCHHHHHQKSKVRKQQGTKLLRLKMYQVFFAVWQMELWRRRQEAEQTAISLWHWSLGLQSKALYMWRVWVSEQQRKRECLARGAHFYRGQLLREGVTDLITHSAHMSSLQTSQRLQRTVQRCAQRWKQRVLLKSQGAPQARGPQPKKNSVPISCPTTAINPGVKAACQIALKHSLRLQPRHHKELLESPMKELGDVRAEKRPLVSKTTMNQPVLYPRLYGMEAPCSLSLNQSQTPPETCCLQPPEVSICSRPFVMTHIPIEECGKHPISSFHSSSCSHGLENLVLLPPSSFMTSKSQTKASNSKDNSLLPPDQITTSGSYMISPVEDEFCSIKEKTDPTMTLTKELLQIQLELKRFEQDRKQLRAWQRLRTLLQSWLTTSSKDDHMEWNSVRQELDKLEENIDRMSEDLMKQKPAMVLHAVRVQHLDTLIHSSGHVLPSRITEAI